LLRKTMSEHVGVVRSGRGLEQALAIFREIGAEAGDDSLIANMALTSKIIAGSAYLRTESRGAHFRSDFPEPVARLARRSAVTLADIQAIGRKSQRVKEKRVEAGLPL
jgi:L-aspartate oxidase